MRPCGAAKDPGSPSFAVGDVPSLMCMEEEERRETNAIEGVGGGEGGL
jgi:hypothetical protein